MAWEQLDALVLNGVTYNCSKLSSEAFQWASTRTSGQTKNDFESDPCDSSNASGFFKVVSRSDIANYTNTNFVFNDNTNKFIYADFSGSYANTAIYFQSLNDTTYLYCNNAGGTNKYPICFGIGVDHENHKAFIWSSNQNGLDSRYAVSTMNSYANMELLYNSVMGSQPVLYNWSSVPAISGKNGILLPLSTLNDVNNGEEITTSDTSKFSLTEASNVAKLVSNIINAQG